MYYQCILTTLIERQRTHVTDVRGHEQADASRFAFFGVLRAQTLYPTLQFVFVEYTMRVFAHIWEELDFFFPARCHANAAADLLEVKRLSSRALQPALRVTESSAHKKLIVFQLKDGANVDGKILHEFGS